MKKMVLFGLLLVMGCGYSSVDNELIAQPKKLFHQTPIVCPNRVDVDLSLGIMRDGVGSMSTHDMYLTVPNEQDIKTLEAAIDDGKLVKIRYNDARFTFCALNESVSSVEIVNTTDKKD